MNYIISRLVNHVYAHPNAGYDIRSDGVKTLECAKHEFERRKLDPYEDKKRRANGDL